MASKKKHQNIYASAAARLAEYEAKQGQNEVAKARRSRDNRLALIVSAGAVVLAAILQLSYFGFGPGHVASSPTPSANASAAPAPSVAESRTWNGTMKINGESLSVSLDGKKAPQAVANFITLAKSGFYNDVSCHRLTTAGIFVLQCGDPKGDGTGGPGYSFGPIENAPADNVYKTGVLAMARQGGNAASMGSQFFIVYKDSPIPADAVGGYTVFGEITKGLDSLQPIIKAGVADGGSDGKPKVETKLGAISLK
ncbi:peptidylprolyl isomerase [Rhodoluna sp.]|uniref:peptidylprolyl isomerase n=1 Tax=Rhodoluna sp. TaxID=1969481 RepID=UPI0025E522A5|nr:peptidylprolyl isomerase [Rhodoluna sp.]